MGLCARFVCGGGQGALGLLVCLSFAFRRVPWRCGVVDCWDVVGMGGVFRFGNKLFGAAYHLRDECHIFNIFGVTVRSE